jgi:hypothetical protein
MGLSTLVIPSATMVVLMLALFALSTLVLRRGLVPLSASLPLRSFVRPVFFLLILPGTIIHEASHVVACWVSRVHVVDVALFDPQPNGEVGHVVYQRCDPLRRNLIAFAPFLGGSLSLYAVMNYVFPGSNTLHLARLAPRLDDPLGSLGTALQSVVAVLAGADLAQPATWLFLYLVFSVGYGISPSKADLSQLLTDGAVLLGLSVSLYAVDVVWHLGAMENGLLMTVALWLAGLLQAVNALLLFSVVVIGLGAAVLLPAAFLLEQSRRSP